MTDLLEITPGYSRSIGIWGGGEGSQEKVYSFNDIVRVVSEHLGLDEIGLSVCRFKENKPELMFLPFDFDADSGDLEKSGKEAIVLYNHFTNAGYDTHFTFSGRRGFHVYVSTVKKTYPKQQIKLIQKYFKDKLKLETLDENIFGDIRRLMRLIYTYNIRGKRLCEEISYSKGKELDLDDIIIINNDFKKYNTKYEKQNYHPYPCIEEIIVTDNEPRELIRLTYVALRLDKGWTEDDIIDEMETFGWIDFNEEICRKKIRYIDGGNYKPLSCKSMMEHGWCPGVCEFGDMKILLNKIGVKNGKKRKKS